MNTPSKLRCLVEQDWPLHRKESLHAMEQVAEMHDTVKEVAQHTKHLTKLDKLDTISDHLKALNDNLVVPATSKKHVPTYVYLLTVGLLGFFVLVLLLRDSDKNLEVTTHGVKLGAKEKP